MTWGSLSAPAVTHTAPHLPVHCLLFLFCLLFNESSPRAEGVSLLLNGKSFHKEQPKNVDYNERNWGVGVQYDFGLINEKWTSFVTASTLKDSFKRNSYYAGGGIMRRFPLPVLHDNLHFDAGLIGFVMVRKDHHNRKPFLGALPALSIGTEKMALNVTYVPEVQPKLAALWFIQLKLSAGLLR